MAEPFSWKKLFDFSPMGFVKVIGLALKVCVIILIVFGVLWVKNLLLPAPEHKEYHVEKGASLVINEAPKKKIQPFAGVYGDSDKDGDWRAGAFGGFLF